MKRKTLAMIVYIFVLGVSSLVCSFTGTLQEPDATLVAAEVAKTVAAVQGTLESELKTAITQTAAVDPQEAASIVQLATATPIIFQQAPETNGQITGKLMYPSEVIPALRIVAFRSGSNDFLEVETKPNSNSYTIKDVPPGLYTIVAYVLDGPAGLSGGYSRAVPCGLSVQCADHTLIEVEVRAGETLTNIDPVDWYAPEGSFPEDPKGE